jgi:filamentous hemagglutinin family protein
MSNPEQNMSVASRKPKRKHGSPLALRTAPTIGKRGAGSAFSFRAASGHRISELGLPGRLLGTLSGLIALTHGLRAYANPTGLSVASGSASATQVGSQLTIQASHNAVLDWPSFNIAAGQTTTFQQPSARSVVWNRIYDQNPSQIQGHLNANGFVVLMNQSGFFFGPNSVINVGGFLATTAPVAPPGVGGGPLWQFNGAPPTASIINYGQIKVANGNALFLVAEKIQNHGVLMAPDGTLGLYAGKEVLVSESPDGRGLSAKVTLPVGSIDNTGRLIADAGTIALHAQVVNQSGLVQANSVRERHGLIELFATDAVNLGAQSDLHADGDGAALSDAGRIVMKSEGTFSDDPASQISVQGSAAGGHGGHVEVSAPFMAAIASQILGGAQAGWTGGELLIDPTDIIIGRTGSTKLPADGAVESTDSPTTLRLNVNTSFRNFARITLQATRDISLDTSTVWNLNNSTQVSAPGSLLRLEAGRNILFGNNSSILAGEGWSVEMAAGADFASPLHLQSGATEGGIYFNGTPPNAAGTRPNRNPSLQTSDGHITLVAAKEVFVGMGFIRTVGGGSIDIRAVTGSVDAGRKTDWLNFNRFGYAVPAAGLGGIGTVAGGNVTIAAGGDILSILPTVGAYGGGDVTLTAAGRILGNFYVKDGIGQLSAGSDLGSASSPVTLALVKGAWEGQAVGSVFVNEVLNPNGTFNASKLDGGLGVPYQFDYAPDAVVKLTAGDSVQLLGTGIERSDANSDLVPTYPPILDVTAGAGGILLGNDVVLFPSALGRLSLKTTAGGPFQSAGDGSFQFVMSDSDQPQYNTYISGHAAAPLHLANAAEPVRLDISGGVQNLRLQIPKRAEIRIGSSTLNFFYKGQNLAPGDFTSLNIAGDVRNRADYTAVAAVETPNLAIFDEALLSPEGASLGLSSRLAYDPATGKLTFQGRMKEAQRDFLLNPTVLRYESWGVPAVDEEGNPLTSPGYFADAATINALFEATQDVPLFPVKNGGFAFGGPGTVNFAARNLDLGITLGIRSVVTALNPALALDALGQPQAGANLNLTLGYLGGDRAAGVVPGAGNLEMVSSQISSFNQGSIDLRAAGSLNVGGQSQFTSDDTPKGIYTGHGGNVTVEALGDIRLNGSRIASYDGGDVSVISRQGAVDAGNGGKGFFLITTDQLNPATGLVEQRTDQFFGSGIVALTRKDSTAQVGNITVKAQGDILANSGGILQLAFNNSDTRQAFVSLDAGRNIEANESGILGANVDLKAGGDIKGLVVANRDISIQANQNVAVTALGGGNVSVSAGGSFSGTAVGGGSVDVSGLSVSGTILSTSGSVSTGGDASSAQTSAFAGVAAPVAKQTTTESEKPLALAQKDDSESADEKKRKPIQLARSVGRVTVILPDKPQ